MEGYGLAKPVVLPSGYVRRLLCFRDGRQERRAQEVQFILLSETQNLLQVGNIFAVDRSSKTLKHGIDQITVSS